ncbi:MAG TPA: rhomboid family intramembrane serine protease [Terracidiphilus sp.]|nr:rhomboid family intramembrane serine protease [Terracidiphilus sp.]
MARIGATQLSFPSFRGATRLLVVANLVTFFILIVLQSTSPDLYQWLVLHGALWPQAFLHGGIWQPLTYSFVQLGISSTLFALLSIWFLAGFLENFHASDWVLGLYGTSVIFTAGAGTLIYAGTFVFGYSVPEIPLYGCFGGVFGMLVVIGMLYGDTEFMLFPLPISIKARYIAIVYGLVAVAYFFTSSRMYAFAQLGGALGGWLFTRMASKRGVSFTLSERWYGLRNAFYRWKRRRAAKKFEVYMKSQGRTVRFDGNGKQIDEDPEDKKRWN